MLENALLQHRFISYLNHLSTWSLRTQGFVLVPRAMASVKAQCLVDTVDKCVLPKGFDQIIGYLYAKTLLYDFIAGICGDYDDSGGQISLRHFVENVDSPSVRQVHICNNQIKASPVHLGKRLAIACSCHHRMMFFSKESVKAVPDGFLVINHKYISHSFLPLQTPLTRKGSAVIARPLPCNLNCSFVPRHTWEAPATGRCVGRMESVTTCTYKKTNATMRSYFLEMASSTSF